MARTDVVSNTADTGKLSVTSACPGLAAASPCEHQPQGTLPPLMLSGAVLNLNFERKSNRSIFSENTVQNGNVLQREIYFFLQYS